MKQTKSANISTAIKYARAAQGLTQLELSKRTGINRSMLSKIETNEYTPSLDQFITLCNVLKLNPADILISTSKPNKSSNGKDNNPDKQAIQKSEAIKLPKSGYTIAVAGTGYVGLSLAVLLAQHNQVTAVDIIPEKVKKLNKFISPIQDEYIEKYLIHSCSSPCMVGEESLKKSR